MEGIWVWILGGPRGSTRDSWRLPRAPAIPGSVCSAFCHPAHPLYPSIRLSAPIFPSQSADQSVCVSLPLSSSPHFVRYYHVSTEVESKHCWLDGYIFISDRLRLVGGLCLEGLHCWPFPSAVILAVAEGYDTFNIVFMAIGDSQASECFSMSSTQWLTASMKKPSTKTVSL